MAIRTSRRPSRLAARLAPFAAAIILATMAAARTTAAPTTAAPTTAAPRTAAPTTATSGTAALHAITPAAATATPVASSAGWVDGDADWQHNSYNRDETQLGLGNAGSLHAGLTVSAVGANRLTMPTIARGSVLYFGSWTPAQSATYYTSVAAHDAATGRLRWRKPASQTLSPPFARQPKYLNGRIYVTSTGGETPSGFFDRTAALDAVTGGKLWEVGGVVDVVGYGQVFVRNYACASGGCSAFTQTAYDAATGRVTWKRAISVPYTFAGGYSGGVLNAGMLYFGEDDAHGNFSLRAVDARSRAPRWSSATSSTPTAVAVDAATGTVLVSEAKSVRAVVGATGRVLWSRTGLDITGRGDFWLPGGTADGAVAVGQGVAYALCATTTGSGVCAIRLSDGQALGPTVQPPSCSATVDVWTALALANGVLYATSSQCGIVAINSATEQVIGIAVPGQGLLRPEVVGGRLYAGTQHAVTAWRP
jgi:PQQ-like domain